MFYYKNHVQSNSDNDDYSANIIGRKGLYRGFPQIGWAFGILVR